MQRRVSWSVFLSYLTIPLTATASEGRTNLPRQSLANASGLSVNLTLVGRLTGSDNTQFTTSLDVTNSTRKFVVCNGRQGRYQAAVARFRARGRRGRHSLGKRGQVTKYGNRQRASIGRSRR